jgi:hypothetical protein
MIARKLEFLLKVGVKMKPIGILGLCFSGVMCVSLGARIDVSKVDQIKACQTTEQELISWFGEPYQRGNRNGFPTMQWMYVKKGLTGAETQSLLIVLNSKRIAVQFLFNTWAALPDPEDKCKSS